MKSKITITALSILILICISFLYTIAADYSIRITRKGQNLYKEENSSIYIKTRYCYEYSYYESVILKNTGYGNGKLVFKNGKEYSIEKIYNGIEPAFGTMVLTKWGSLEEAELILVPATLR